MSTRQAADLDATAYAEAVQTLAGAVAEVRTLAEARAHRPPVTRRR